MTIEKATFGELVDILTYANYKHNRQLDPSISAERWEKVYGPSVYAMEKKFQEETHETCDICAEPDESVVTFQLDEYGHESICEDCREDLLEKL